MCGNNVMMAIHGEHFLSVRKFIYVSEYEKVCKKELYYELQNELKSVMVLGVTSTS